MGLTNEYTELMEITADQTIKCAEVFYEDDNYNFDVTKFILTINYSEEKLNAFYTALKNINYDNSYGHQYISGTIWLTSGTWIERGEYDGSEWWRLVTCPEIPDYLTDREN